MPIQRSFLRMDLLGLFFFFLTSTSGLGATVTSLRGVRTRGVPTVTLPRGLRTLGTLWLW